MDDHATSKNNRSADKWLGGLAAVIAAVAAIGGLTDSFPAKTVGLIALVAAVLIAIGSSLAGKR